MTVARHTAVASDPRSIVMRLADRAAARPEQPVFEFLAAGDAVTARLDTGGLFAAAAALAADLDDLVQPGDRVLLLHAPGPDLVVAFFACLMHGAIAVPLQAPRRLQSLDKLLAVAADCQPALVLTDAESLPALAPRLAQAGGLLANLPLRAPALPAPHAPHGAGLARALPDLHATAFLQYTSGSTGQPKGVRVTHANLVANAAMIQSAFGYGADTVMVGWLPLFHDMGLIGTVVQPVATGFRSVLMPPAAFLQKPMRWLRAISTHHATTSGGPNFGYALCLQRLREADLAGVDLSAWRVAFNGAEPVRASTLREFARRLAPWGLRPQALRPCYGMAEATLLVSGGPIDAAAQVARLDAAALEAQRVREVDAGASDRADVREVVSCGVPQAGVGQALAIVDPHTLQRCAAEAVGEIWLRGPHLSSGYWGRDDAARPGAHHGRLDDQVWFRTGDLGFLLRGELHVCARLKDLLILKGRNIHPQDVEQLVAAADPAFEPHGCAAFTVDGPGGERLVVMQEIRREHRRRVDTPAGADALRGLARAAVAREFDLTLHDLVLCPTMSLPKTSSGKIRRQACRAQYLDSLSKPQEPEPLEESTHASS